MHNRGLIILLLFTLFLLSCSDSDSAGATGVGNPTEVAIVAATGDVVGQGGFDSTKNRSSIEPAKVIRDLRRRAYTLSAIDITVDSFSWQIQVETLEDEIDPKLTLKDEKLYYFGPVVFDALNPEPLNLHLPTAGYKAVRFFIGKDDEDSDEQQTETTIVIKGTYTNDDDIAVPFVFEMAYGIELIFMKKGKPYYWESGSETRLDLLLDLDEWFTDIDILDHIGISGNATDEVKATISTNSIRMRIKKSGVLSIYEK